MTAEWIQYSSGDCDNCADNNHNHVNGVYDGSVDDDDGGGDLAARLRGCSQLASGLPTQSDEPPMLLRHISLPVPPII